MTATIETPAIETIETSEFEKTCQTRGVFSPPDQDHGVKADWCVMMMCCGKTGYVCNACQEFAEEQLKVVTAQGFAYLTCQGCDRQHFNFQQIRKIRI